MVDGFPDALLYGASTPPPGLFRLAAGHYNARRRLAHESTDWMTRKQQALIAVGLIISAIFLILAFRNLNLEAALESLQP